MNNTSISTYVFIPVHNSFKIAITSINTFTGVYGFIANLLILYFTSKRPRNRRQSFDRQPVTDRFIQSLALSDVLCALVSMPLFTAELFLDFVQTNQACKVFRYVQIYLPVTTVVNYLLIGVERYLSVFYPFKVPSVKIVKKLVIVAWFASALVDLIPVVSYNLVHFELSNSTYTRACKYDNSKKPYRIAFITFTLVTWTLPCVLLVFINVRILRYLRRQQQSVRDVTDASQITNVRRQVRCNRMNRLIVSLIFAFVIPYLSFFFYSAFVMLLKIQMSFEVDYIARYLCVIFIYANGAIGSTILFYSSKYHQRRLVRLCRRIFCIKKENAVHIAANG